jgi:hypothetical protein
MKRSIVAARKIPVAFALAREILLDVPAAVLTVTPTTRELHAGNLRTTLSVDIGAGASVHQEVTLRLDAARAIEPRLVLPVTWLATGHQRLLPAFAGELDLWEAGRDTALRVAGTYTIPLGVAGVVADRVAGGRLVHRSLRALVDQIASRLESEAARRTDAIRLSREADEVVLQASDHPEIYIG